MRGFIATLAGLSLSVGLLVVAIRTIMTLVEAGDYLLATLGFGLTLGLLATGAVATLVSTLKG